MDYVKSTLAVVYIVWGTVAYAQNQSQMGNAGYFSCTTRQCIENVRLVRLGFKNLCTTDRDCEGYTNQIESTIQNNCQSGDLMADYPKCKQ
jgi:hypothetical protein